MVSCVWLVKNAVVLFYVFVIRVLIGEICDRNLGKMERVIEGNFSKLERFINRNRSKLERL